MGVKTFEAWSSELAQCVAAADCAMLEQAAAVIAEADLVIVAGNGGSASLASHFAQAIAKPDYAAGGGRAAICLNDNVPTWSAHANDGGWPSALVEAARPFVEAVPGCAIVIFSSSGRSENVCRLGLFAIERNCPLVAFTGFSGGPLRDIANVSIHVDSHDYEVVEPAHDALLHRVQYHLRTGGKVLRCAF